ALACATSPRQSTESLLSLAGGLPAGAFLRHDRPIFVGESASLAVHARVEAVGGGQVATTSARNQPPPAARVGPPRISPFSRKVRLFFPCYARIISLLASCTAHRVSFA